MFSTYEDKRGVMSAVPSLKSMSMVKVAVSICTGGTLKEDILGLSFVGNREPGCMNEKKVRTAIEKLNVPNSLLDPLANQILLVALGMRNWGLSLNGHFDLDAGYCTSMLGSSMFLSNGKIDKVQVAREVARDQQLNVSKKFDIACFYWLEDSIVDFWGQMTVEQRRTLNDTDDCIEAPYESLAGKVACELEKGGGLVFSDRVAVREMIECATTTGSEVTVRHLWSQLDPAEVEEIAEAMISELPLCLSNDYRIEEIVDIFCFLFPKLKEHRRWMFAFEVKFDAIGWQRSLFDMLVSANRIHAISDLMSTSMQYMHGSKFVTALSKILFAMCWPDATCQEIYCDDYRELVKKIWTHSPVHLKKYAITENTSLWTQLLSPTEKTRDIFVFFLEDATREEKLDMIFSNGGEGGLICVDFHEDVSVADFLLQLLNLSQDEKRRLLKREILLHDPFTRNFNFGLAARYCLQFEDDDTKAEYKRKLVGDRIEEICIHYFQIGLIGYWWPKLDSLLGWYFSTAEEIRRFKTTLWETSGPDICQRLHYSRESMQACYEWFGLDPNEIRELESRALSTLPGL